VLAGELICVSSGLQFWKDPGWLCVYSMYPCSGLVLDPCIIVSPPAYKSLAGQLNGRAAMQWSKIASKIIIWLVTELLLNLVGLDNLADYSEFIAGERSIQQESQQIVLLSAPFQPPLSDIGSVVSDTWFISLFAAPVWPA
jgi:hypothetical protein